MPMFKGVENRCFVLGTKRVHGLVKEVGKERVRVVVNLTVWCERAWEMRGTEHVHGKWFWPVTLGLIQIYLSD